MSSHSSPIISPLDPLLDFPRYHHARVASMNDVVTSQSSTIPMIPPPRLVRTNTAPTGPSPAASPNVETSATAESSNQSALLDLFPTPPQVLAAQHTQDEPSVVQALPHIEIDSATLNAFLCGELDWDSPTLSPYSWSVTSDEDDDGFAALLALRPASYSSSLTSGSSSASDPNAPTDPEAKLVAWLWKGQFSCQMTNAVLTCVNMLHGIDSVLFRQVNGASDEDDDIDTTMWGEKAAQEVKEAANGVVDFLVGVKQDMLMREALFRARVRVLPVLEQVKGIHDLGIAVKVWKEQASGLRPVASADVRLFVLFSAFFDASTYNPYLDLRSAVMHPMLWEVAPYLDTIFVVLEEVTYLTEILYRKVQALRESLGSALWRLYIHPGAGIHDYEMQMHMEEMEDRMREFVAKMKADNTTPEEIVETRRKISGMEQVRLEDSRRRTRVANTRTMLRTRLTREQTF
ncbi:MAG: hypothetical protein M1833_000850 [Piccolia ochrophora]|nr:MAG: hypothetical protein M1833_000850 [Piccolia ochrophora]